jgi:hypothetical protein
MSDLHSTYAIAAALVECIDWARSPPIWREVAPSFVGDSPRSTLSRHDYVRNLKENSPQNLTGNAAVPFNPKDNGIATTCS